MLDEEVLSRKLKILIVWLGAIETGEHAMTAHGATTFIAVLEQCHDEALALERGNEVVPADPAGCPDLTRAVQSVAGSAANVVILPVVQHLRTPVPLPADATPTNFRQEISHDLPV